MPTRFSVQICQDHLENPREFPQDLSARAARWRGRLGGRNDDHTPELAVAFESALNIATRSAQTVRPYVAFSMLQPVTIVPSRGFERSADFETEYSACACSRTARAAAISASSFGSRPAAFFGSRIPDPGSRSDCALESLNDSLEQRDQRVADAAASRDHVVMHDRLMPTPAAAL
jgi:hypothetical protein